MKRVKVLLLFLILLLVTTLLFSEPDYNDNIDKYIILKQNTNTTQTNNKSFNTTTKYDFRKSKWGMSKKDVEKSESNKLKEENELLYSDIKFLGINCYLQYQFRKNKLVGAGYVFYGQLDNSKKYIQNYFKIRSFLILVYKNPILSHIYSVYQQIIYDKNSWEKAFDMGILSFIDIWETKRTKIILQLKKESDGKIYFNLIFMRKENKEK